MSKLRGRAIESIGGNEYISALIYEDTDGVAGVELLTADPSERPEDGVCAMEALNADCLAGLVLL